MMKLLRSVYDHSPIFVQNAMTSCYGYRLHASRYGGSYKKHLAEIEPSQWWPNEELHALQMRALRKLLRHAYEHVPFYRERFQHAEFHPDHLSSLDDLRKLPLLTRKDIIAHGEQMVADTSDLRRLRQHFTSGTTGTPLCLYEDADVLQRTYAFWTRFRRWFGFQEWLPRATLGGRVIVPRSQKRPPYWRYNRAENQLLLSSFHMSEETIPAYIERLEQFSPYLIDGYVSTIFRLARYINREGIRSILPSAVQTTSETLLETHRHEIERAFQCHVFNQYSHGEKAVFISECQYGTLHINDEFGVVEIIHEGRPAQAGETGELVVTSFNNWAMPLIRYQTGDLAVASCATACPCGRGLSIVESIEGRIIDFLRMPDGKMVPPTALTLLFDKAHAMGIDEAQIRQIAPDEIRVHLVLHEKERALDTRPLEQDLRSMMGNEAYIHFELVDTIPRTQAGKFKFVVSEIDSQI